MTQNQQQPSLASQLRADQQVVQRRLDDAAQLVNAINIGAQLADQCDTLLAENARLDARVKELERELLDAVAGGAVDEPGESDFDPTADERDRL